MRIQTLPSRLSTAPNTDVKVVIDILRATTTIAAALVAGATAIYPAASATDARRLAQANQGALLAGERGGMAIPGFDFGNSPREFPEEVVSGRSIVMTTTNGTRAIQDAGSGSIVCLALTNRAAVARWLSGMTSDVTVICAGEDGNFSAEDLAGAGALVTSLRQMGFNLQVDDLSHVAETWFRAHQDRLFEMLCKTSHGSELVTLGMLEDVRACAQIDTLDVVPVYEDGKITAHTTIAEQAFLS